MSPSPARILVVDDEPANLALIHDILGADYQLHMAQDGPQALRIAADIQPDLILLDLMLPGMDGYGVCEQLKNTSALADIPVIMVTARDQTQDELRGFAAGAVEFITKPIRPALLRVRVQNHLKLNHLNKRLQADVEARTRELEMEVRRREQAMARAEYLTLHHPRSGLPNQRQLRLRLQQYLAAHANGAGRCGLLQLQPDGLDRIRQGGGPEQVDHLLSELGERLRVAAGRDDFVAHLEDDSLAVMVPLPLPRAAEEDRQKLDRLADLLRKTLGRPIHDMAISLCVGGVLAPDDAASAELALDRAHIALANARRAGANQTRMYAPTMAAQARRIHQLERQLQVAILEHRLDIHLQPQVHLASGQISGAEALIRWPDGAGGYIANSSFLPLAADAGLGLAIDNAVLEQSLDWLQANQNALPPGFRLGINMSAQALSRPGWLEALPQQLHDREIEPQRVELEITEQSLIQDMHHTHERLRRLCAQGLHVAADDFGSGYSSLAWLDGLPIDRIKLDRLFLRRLEHSPRAATLAASMIQLADELDLDCVLEGIEETSQWRFARAHGAPHGQGYLLSHPIAPDAFSELLSGGLCLPQRPASSR